jgi:quinol-cytochrome oxidoreductase complex cytochrome b subunit
MLDLTPLQILLLGVGILIAVIIYFFREHLIDIGDILWGHKKFIAVAIIVCFVVFCIIYVVITYKPPPLPVPEPVFSINISQIGYTWPG